jgi:RNA polymerase sigma-70 factor (ECF subfamily)
VIAAAASGGRLRHTAGPAVNQGRGVIRSSVVGTALATDERLMRELYDAHAGVLLGYVRRLVGGDLARAEDVVQETLLRAWRHPEALDASRSGGASVRAWLLTVARHLVIDGERARKARPLEVPQALDGVERPPASHLTTAVDDELDRILLAHGMADALQALTQDHRAVVEQLYYLDRSVAVAACALGVPEGTVKSRAYYALRALRVACEERGIVP